MIRHNLKLYAHYTTPLDIDVALATITTHPHLTVAIVNDKVTGVMFSNDVPSDLPQSSGNAVMYTNDDVFSLLGARQHYVTLTGSVQYSK